MKEKETKAGKRRKDGKFLLVLKLFKRNFISLHRLIWGKGWKRFGIVVVITLIIISAALSMSMEDIQVPPPPFSEDIFPCSQCHAEQEPNPQRRVLEMHEDIVLKHAEQNRWCLDCHDAKNRDMLHMADGELVDFKESYRLCGQCHGPKLRDWRAGIHGRRTGSWSGRKRYLLCIHCHDPHSPKFKKLKPEPPPVKPGRIRQ